MAFSEALQLIGIKGYSEAIGKQFFLQPPLWRKCVETARLLDPNIT